MNLTGKYQTCKSHTSEENFISLRYLLKHLFYGLVGLAIWTPIDFEGAYHMLFKGNGQSNANVQTYYSLVNDFHPKWYYMYLTYLFFPNIT